MNQKLMTINGKKVVNATKRLILSISQEDVAAGKTKAPDACAAAIACVRQLGAISAKVHLARTYVEFNNKWVRFQTPGNLRTEIVSFDRGHKFEASDYILSPIFPSDAAKLGGMQGTAPKRYDKPNPTPRRKHHVTTGVRASYARPTVG